MDGQANQSWQGSRTSPNPARSSPGLPQQRRYDESWVEVASQPSSSSLSSIGDEIVTTGLRVGNPYVRRRRLQPSARSLPQQNTAIHNVSAADISSQEEYDESDSEDDRLLTSSTENAQRSVEEMDLDSEAESDGDNVTALGRVSDRSADQPVFRPQPNAFTHPSTQRRDSAPAIPTAPPPHPHNGLTRPSFTQRSQTRPHRAGPSFMSPAVREENDAALRASLTTLLSCAHAARALPKSKEEAEAQRTASAGVGPSSQPMELRLVPESELSQESPRPRRAQRPAAPSPPRKRAGRSRSPSRTSERGKHNSGSPTTSRAAKKKKVAQMEEPTIISPTLLTWVVSAGVVIVVSVVGFGAGYVIGREVGKQEALAVSVGSVNDTTSCGQEVIRSSGSGLRKLRWGAVGKSIVA
ncbi:hypothetical protein FLONG3_9189 [Fusarium longipes]|uniref:Uncharacterized protein n=1 Tax=Fusarium longipes TaxID=694270 RepID=A0A395RZV6_9HYPO|nr:hypothetical protein FLONG3_9189 [Fusarium longipes]